MLENAPTNTGASGLSAPIFISTPIRATRAPAARPPQAAKRLYHVTDCTSLLYGPDGKPTASPTNGKAGTAFAVPIIPAHSAENIGPADCHQIFVERK
jgi:hypothetical protein